MLWLTVLASTGILASPGISIGSSVPSDPLASADFLATESAFAASSPARPPLNHGPSTSGGGTSTISGETLRKGAWDIELRTDYTRFEDVSIAEAEAKAEEIGHFDALESAFVETLSVQHGLTSEVQLGLQIGYYRGSNFVDAHVHGSGHVGTATGDPSGLTDAWITGKWRLVRGAPGHLSVLGGVKLPVGDDDETLSGGHPLDPSSQPGTGSVDWQAGVAYSRYLNERVTLDASALYTLRTEHDDFEVGDRADLGLALAYRLTEDVRARHAWSVFGELAGTWLGEDEEGGERNENSGGEVLYLGLGARDRVNEHFSFAIAPAFPIYQAENGEQVEAEWRVAATLSFGL